MGYSPENASSPAGEICIRGPGVFTSYYKNEAMSKECFGRLKKV
jgi:long-subunit acyl-CoA synthetase (AMP-forming)